MAVRTPVRLNLLLAGSASEFVETTLDRASGDSFEADVEAVPDVPATREALEDGRHDCVIASAVAGAVDAASVVETVRSVDPDRPVVAVVDDEASATAAVDAGATDVLSQGVAEADPGLLRDRIRRAAESAPGAAIPGSRSWYDALLADSMDALTVIAADGTITYQNPSVERLLGYDPEALVGTDSLAYIHPEDHDRVEAAFADCYDRGDGATADLEFRFRAADDSWEWLESVVTSRTARGIEGYVVNSSVITERKAREREVERYETLLGVVPDTIAITDTEGYHVDIYGYEGWSGYEPEELIDEHISKTTPEADVERAENIVRELISDDDREKATFETRVETRDGEMVPVETHVRPLPPDDDGEIPGLMHVLRNVADRKEREHRLEAAETAFENVQDGVFLAELTDGEFRFQRVNPSYRDAAPLHDADIVGKTPTQVAGPEIGGSIETRLRECVEERSAIEYERELTFDGETTYWHNRLAPVVDDGEAVGVVGAIRDVTERIERERELRLKNRAMDEAPIGITVSTATEAGAELVYANQGYETLTGYSFAELEGEDWWRILFGEETDTGAVASLEATLGEEGHASAELQLYRKDGTPRWFQVSVSPLTDEAGEATHFVSFQQDITERKEYETEIERRFDEFADVFAEDLREPIERARSSVGAARTNDDEAALEDATEWLDRADDLLADLVTVHSFSVPSRDHSESALLGSVDGE